MTIGREPLQQGNIDMPRYFFDLDNGKANFVDTIGTELNGPEMIRSDAIGFLATVFKDEAHDSDDPAYLASVRDEAGRVIFTTALTLQSNWQLSWSRAGGIDSPQRLARAAVLRAPAARRIIYREGQLQSSAQYRA